MVLQRINNFEWIEIVVSRARLKLLRLCKNRLCGESSLWWAWAVPEPDQEGEGEEGSSHLLPLPSPQQESAGSLPRKLAE